MNMMGVLDLIEPKFNTLWNAVHSDIPIAWDNAPENIPDDGIWLRVTVVPIRVFNGTMEGDKQVTGQIVIQVFTPLDIGAGPAYTLADEIAALLENISIGAVLTYGADIVRIGEGQRRVKDIEHGEFQVNVKVPFDAQ